jgi:hypothetical protein
MGVEILVPQMQDTLSQIRVTVDGLSTQEQSERLNQLEHKRERLLADLRTSFDRESQDVETKREAKLDEIRKKRKQEDEEREARRRQEDEELRKTNSNEDTKRKQKLDNETDSVEDETEQQMDEIEESARKMIEEGKQKLKDLEEKRRVSEVEYSLMDRSKADTNPCRNSIAASMSNCKNLYQLRLRGKGLGQSKTSVAPQEIQLPEPWHLPVREITFRARKLTLRIPINLPHQLRLLPLHLKIPGHWTRRLTNLPNFDRLLWRAYQPKLQRRSNTVSCPSKTDRAVIRRQQRNPPRTYRCHSLRQSRITCLMGQRKYRNTEGLSQIGPIEVRIVVVVGSPSSNVRLWRMYQQQFHNY